MYAPDTRLHTRLGHVSRGAQVQNFSAPRVPALAERRKEEEEKEKKKKKKKK